MAVIYIISVLAFSAVICYVEIPPLLKSKSYKLLLTFSILLALGVILVILKCLNFAIANPSDWVAWVFSPVSNFLKAFLLKKG